MWFNGFDYKTVIYINGNYSLEECLIPIQRMVWMKGSKKHKHIYLRPSCVLKHCPFPMSTIEFIWEKSVSIGIEPFDLINDPDCLLESSLPLEYYSRKIFSCIGNANYQAKWNKLFYRMFYTLPIVKAPLYSRPDVSLSGYTCHLIELFAGNVNLILQKHEILAFANFQIPLW